MALNETFTNPDVGATPFILDGFPVVAESETLIAGQNLIAGSVLGKITTGGKLTFADDAATDGSKVPYTVLASDVDATSADAACVVYKAAIFATDKLVKHASITDAIIKAAWDGKPMFLKTPLVLQS